MKTSRDSSVMNISFNCTHLDRLLRALQTSDAYIMPAFSLQIVNVFSSLIWNLFFKSSRILFRLFSRCVKFSCRFGRATSLAEEDEDIIDEESNGEEKKDIELNCAIVRKQVPQFYSIEEARIVRQIELRYVCKF